MMAGFTGRASGQGKLELGHLRDLWWCTGGPDRTFFFFILKKIKISKIYVRFE